MKKCIFTQKIIALVLITVLLSSTLPIRAKADSLKISVHRLIVNGNTSDVHVIDYEYANNAYISLKDMAVALSGTGNKFDVGITSSSVDIKLGQRYSFTPLSEGAWNDEYVSGAKVNLKNNDITVNSEKKKYSSIIVTDANGSLDAFLSVIDLAMILDIKTTMDEDENIYMDTEVLFSVDPKKLEEDGFFQGVNSVLVGNASTGQIYYEYDSEKDYPIASTTKLMTYLLTMDAIADGSISMDSVGTVSKEGEKLSKSADGVIVMSEGDKISVRQLIIGALLPSSNECALTLAELIANDEAAFVKKMNEKADSLGMNTAIFYNCNGLPVFTKSSTPGKMQNRMSSKDMFKMVSHILNVYPQVTDITSMKTAKVEPYGQEVKNTNGVLYNIPECTGLKTGTTNKSGACLITSFRYNEQDIVVVLLGAESSTDRIRISEVLGRYAMHEADSINPEEEEEMGEGKLEVEDIVRFVLKKAKAA